MAYDPRIHHRPLGYARGRHSIRLPGYDYTRPGPYFVTIVAKNRAYIFGEIMAGEMKSNDAGKIVKTMWNEIPVRFPIVNLDEFIVMPNHIHGIIVLPETVGVGRDGTVGAGLPRPYVG
jgi:putative transposase